MDIKNCDVLVLGGGASGMMAAICAARAGAHVVLIEKNKRLGEKIRISGGGRCNITNAEFDTRIFLQNYGASAKFLHSAFAQFGVEETISFFNELGLGIMVEAKKRAFPLSQDANDVVKVLETEMTRLGVEVVRNTRITKVKSRDCAISAVNCGRQVYVAQSYILATGGMSRPETGSTGDGFDWLEEVGHHVSVPSPSITPLALRDTWVAKASGITVPSVHVTFYANGEKSFRLDGDVLFTHFGISGPLILSNAYRVGELLTWAEVTAKVDLFPGMNDKELDQHIVRILNENGAKQLKNVITYVVPAGFGPAIKEIFATGVNFDSKCSELPKDVRRQIVVLLKAVPLFVDSLMGMDKAVVADGGVSLSEINTRTFRSQKISNLYITGDLLDINRPSGGFSLQLCWTTGYIAGNHAAKIS